MVVLAALISASLLGLGCGGAAGSEPAAPERLVLSERDDGRTVTMRLGRTGVLQHPSRLVGAVKASGSAVSVFPVETL